MQPVKNGDDEDEEPLDPEVIAETAKSLAEKIQQARTLHLGANRQRHHRRKDSCDPLEGPLTPRRTLSHTVRPRAPHI
jgi:hypothetical protein